ncbi:MAG: universal stress protein [Candidatus Lokiarchaeota archaeon]|nr:universal stress protein [Candidatus Lokiarchaeota archaeon]
MKKDVKKEIDESYKRIIVPVDGSELSKKAAKIGCFFAHKANKKIIFIHVIELPATALPHGEATYVPNISDTLKENGESILNEIKEACSDSNIDFETKMVEGIPDNEIIDFANDNDLIIMGSKGHSAFERVLVGSVSEKVLHHSDSSVMIVR